MKQRLILASSSRYRRALMDRLGLPYEAIEPVYAEVAPDELSPVECAHRFARGKAEAVAKEHPDALVIGADQALEIEGRMLRKPENLDEASEQLLTLSGRWHLLHSAVALWTPDGLRGGLATVELRMRQLSREQAKRYAALDLPHGSVGGYIYEQRGFALFDEVRGSDDSAIVGLPLWLLGRLLREVGLDSLGA